MLIYLKIVCSMTFEMCYFNKKIALFAELFT